LKEFGGSSKGAFAMNKPEVSARMTIRKANLEKIGEGSFAANAHTVAVYQRTHRVYFPLQNVGAKPVLRIALPSDKKL